MASGMQPSALRGVAFVARHEAALAGSGAGSSRAHYECVFQRDNQLPRDIKAEIRAPANLP